MVVIAVAVVLTGLLMPAMRQLHENAHRVICMSNMQQIGQGFLIYGNDYNDLLPYSVALSENRKPQNLMAARQEGFAAWDGMGILYGYGYCTMAECFYCPSHHGNHPFERYADHWSNPLPQLAIFTNYHYAGHVEWGTDRRRKMLEGHDLVLATDGLRTVQDFNHVHGMNVLRADGSVRWRDDAREILEQLPKNEDELALEGYAELWNDIEEQD
jgi:hypothetical protein